MTRTTLYRPRDTSLLARTRQALFLDIRIGWDVLGHVLGAPCEQDDDLPCYSVQFLFERSQESPGEDDAATAAEHLHRLCRLLLPDHAAEDASILRKLHGWSAPEVQQIQEMLSIGEASLRGRVPTALLEGTRETLRRDADALLALYHAWADVLNDAPR